MDNASINISSSKLIHKLLIQHFILDSLGICFHTTIGTTTLDGSLDESSTVVRQPPTIPNPSPPTVSPASNSLDIDKESVGNTFNEQDVDNNDGFNNTSHHLPLTESTADSRVGMIKFMRNSQ